MKYFRNYYTIIIPTVIFIMYRYDSLQDSFHQCNDPLAFPEKNEKERLIQSWMKIQILRIRVSTIEMELDDFRRNHPVCFN